MRNQQIEQYAPSPDRSPPSGLLEREEADKAMIGFFLESGDLDAESALELIAGYAEEPAQEDLEGFLRVKEIAQS